MKRSLLLCWFSLLVSMPAFTQTAGTKNKKNTQGEHAIVAGIQLPVGNFSNTHWLGAGISYAPSHVRIAFFKQSKLAFTYNGGIAYYLGRKEVVSGYSYTYPGYFFLHAFAGAAISPVRKALVSLTAGPALGMYNKDTRFSIGSQLDLRYYLNKNLAIGPGLVLMKESGADPLWAASVKACWVF